MNKYITPKLFWLYTYCMWLFVALVALLSLFFSFQEEDSYEGGSSHLQYQDFVVQQTSEQQGGLQEAFSTPLYGLSGIDRPLHLPDLRSTLLFFGCNERPDRSLSSTYVQFGIRSVQKKYSVPAEEKAYLIFDPHSNKWALSQEPTPLSIRFIVHTGGVEVCVELIGDNDESVVTPHELRRFSLTTTSLPPSMNTFQQWAVGDTVAEPSLLEKQGAVWYGYDECVRAFGGEEMSFQADRQRIQFGEIGETYTIWAGVGDCFIFDEDGWQYIEPGPESVGKTILQVKSIDQRTIIFDLWNAEGSSRISLALMKKDAVHSEIPEMKLVGALSRKQWIAEIQGKRITVAPDDWIVFSSGGYIKLDTPELLDDYLEGQIQGSLLACSGIEKRRGESCLIGSFFDITRTKKEEIAISLYRSWDHRSSVQAEQSGDDDEEEEYYFDDDEETDEE